MHVKSSFSLFLLFALFTACTPDKPATEETATVIEKKETPVTETLPEPDTTGIPENLMIDNNLTNKWVRALNNLDTENFTADKKPYINRHNPAVTDTIITLRNGSTTIDYYHTPHNDMLQSARITNNAIQLPNGIKTGMQKGELEQVLDRKIAGNKVVVGDEERFSIFRFEFAADTLRQIIFEGYVD